MLQPRAALHPAYCTEWGLEGAAVGLWVTGWSLLGAQAGCWCQVRVQEGAGSGSRDGPGPVATQVFCAFVLRWPWGTPDVGPSAPLLTAAPSMGVRVPVRPGKGRPTGPHSFAFPLSCPLKSHTENSLWIKHNLITDASGLETPANSADWLEAGRLWLSCSLLTFLFLSTLISHKQGTKTPQMPEKLMAC